MGANGSGTGSALLAAAQWMTDPDGNPATADQPSVINNSWSAATANDTWFRPMIRRWLELGIVPVFAAGNTGPGPGSVGSPAGYPEAIAVGAMDADFTIPSFSGRGPVIWQNSDGQGPAAGTVLAKPDIVAPGVGIVSTVPHGYLAFSGTSMASPHVAGVAALVRQLNPALSPAAVADILRGSASDLGTPGIDAASGTGRVDALRALESAFGPAPDTGFARTPAAETRSRVLDYAIAPLGGGLAVRTRVDGAAWSEPTTDLDFSLTLPEGRHVVEAQAIDPSGAVDATPARHVVTIDRTGPRIVVLVFRAGTATDFRSRVTGAVPASIRWSFGDGETARGPRVRRSFAESRARRVVVTARDRVGNVSFVVRTIRPRAAGAVRDLAVPAVVSRNSGEVPVTGQLVRPATLRASLRQIHAATAARIGGPAAAFMSKRLGPPVSRTAVATSGAVGFRLRMPLRGLAPGAYRLELTAGEPGTRLGRLRLIRRLVVR
jgi:hypothetical protein